jgi:hypothetical protein
VNSYRLNVWGLSGQNFGPFSLLGEEFRFSENIEETFIIVGGSDAFKIIAFVMMWNSRSVCRLVLNRMQILWTAKSSYCFSRFSDAALQKPVDFRFHTGVPDCSKVARRKRRMSAGIAR